MTISVVCAGAGWAANERHLPSLKTDPRIRVVGVVDPEPGRAEALARRFSIQNWSTALDAPWLADVECMMIGAPPLEHAALIETALDRGWHCLSEKPFAFPASRGAALVEQARDQGRLLAAVHNFQFSRAGRKLFGLIETNALGRLEALYGFQLSNPSRTTPVWARDLPGGLFLDEGPHLLYLMRRILGALAIRKVDARLEGNAIRDVYVSFDHERIWASLAMSFNASVFEWQLLVVGSTAVAAFDLVRDILIVVPNDEGHKGRDVLRSSRSMVAGHTLGFITSGFRFARKRLLYGNDEVVRRFVDAVEGDSDRLRWMTGEDGVAAVSCLEEIISRAGIEPAFAASV